MSDYTPGIQALKAAWIAQRVAKGTDRARAEAEADRAIEAIQTSSGQQ